MSNTVSIRIDDELFNEVKLRANILHLSKTEYIRKAIESMNHEMKLKEQNDQLKQASLRVRKESMKINAEFERIAHDSET